MPRLATKLKKMVFGGLAIMVMLVHDFRPMTLRIYFSIDLPLSDKYTQIIQYYYQFNLTVMKIAELVQTSSVSLMRYLSNMWG